MPKGNVTKGKQIKPKEDKGKKVTEIREELKQDEPQVRERLMEIITEEDDDISTGNRLKAIELFYRYAMGPAPHVVDDGQGGEKAAKDSSWVTLIHQANFYEKPSDNGDNQTQTKDITPKPEE